MKKQRMKLLLVYPQQADRPLRRTSRAGAQLNSIARALNELVERCTNQNLLLRKFVYEKDGNDNAQNQALVSKELVEILDDTDVVIEVSTAAHTIISQGDFAGPVIHIAPTFIGSFACNDISINACGRLQQSDVVHCIGESQPNNQTALPSTHEFNADMHYSAFAPLPSRVGDAFYRAEKDHALVFLSLPEHLRDENALDADMQVLNKVLHTVERLRSVTFVCETLEDVPLVQTIADSLQSALNIKASIWGLRKGEYHDMFSIMAKADVVLFGGGCLFADAILHGIPVYPWRNNIAGTENIAQAYRQFSTDRKKDRNILLKAQRKHLDRLIEAQYLDATLPNDRIGFENVIVKLINHALHTKSFIVTAPADDSPTWVIPPAQASVHRAMPDKLSRSVWSDRQMLLQFKQSPNQAVLRSSKKKVGQVFTPK